MKLGRCIGKKQPEFKGLFPFPQVLSILSERTWIARTSLNDSATEGPAGLTAARHCKSLITLAGQCKLNF